MYCCLLSGVVVADDRTKSATMWIVSETARARDRPGRSPGVKPGSATRVEIAAARRLEQQQQQKQQQTAAAASGRALLAQGL